MAENVHFFTNITPLPPQVSREVAIAMLHNHDEMIELNPLVIEHHPIKTPRDAPCRRIPGLRLARADRQDPLLAWWHGEGEKSATRRAFHDMPTGLQTHIYAPMYVLWFNFVSISVANI